MCVAIVAVVHERETVEISEQLLTRLLGLRRPPVFRWILPIALSTYFSPRLLLLVDGE